MPFAFARSVLAGGTPEPVYTLSASPTSANEGQSVTITLTTENVDVGTSIPYSITGINSADLSSGSINGNFIIEAGGADSLNFTFANDAASEGTETMVLTAAEQTVSVNVADTSRAITYEWYTTPSATPDEGDVLNFVARVYNSSETMWWHQNLPLTDVNPSQGQLTKAGPFTSGSDFYYTHTGSTTIQEDVTTEGNETMYLYLRSGSQYGTIRDTFTMVIQDTSVPLTSDRIGSGVGNAAGSTDIVGVSLTAGAYTELANATHQSGYDWGDSIIPDISYNGMWALVIGQRLGNGNGGVAVFKRDPAGAGASMSWDFVEIIQNATQSTVYDASISDDGKWVFMTRSDATDVVAVYYSSSPGSTSYSLSTTLSGLSQGGGNASYCRWVDIDKDANRMFMGLEFKYRSGTTNGYGGVLCWRRSGSSWSVEKFFQHSAAQSVNYQWGHHVQPPSIAKKDGDVIIFMDKNANNYSTTGFGSGYDAPHDASGNHYIHVYRRSGNSWYESTYNMGNGNNTDNHVTVSGDGGNFITFNPKGSNPHLFTFNKSNGTITSTNSSLPVGTSGGNRDSIVLNEDASVALVHYVSGTYQYRSNFYDRSGSTFVTRTGWTHAIEPNYGWTQVISNSSYASHPSVKMTGSGNTVIIQSDFPTGNEKGAKILNVY